MLMYLVEYLIKDIWYSNVIYSSMFFHSITLSIVICVAGVLLSLSLKKNASAHNLEIAQLNTFFF